MSSTNACIAFENLADLPTTFVRASSAAPFLPVQLLRDPHISRRWRSVSGAASLFLDFQEPAGIDTVALIGCSMGLAGTMRLRLSTSDSLTESGVVLDRTIAGACDPAYGYQIGLIDAPIAARYLRIDLEEPGADFVEAGRLVVGRRHAFSFNFAPGWSLTFADPSVKTKSAGGSTFVGLRRRYRVLDITFPNNTPADRWGFIEALERTRGASSDVLMIRDPKAVNLGQASIWGLNIEATPIAEQFFRNFSKQFRIEERL